MKRCQPIVVRVLGTCSRRVEAELRCWRPEAEQQECRVTDVPVLSLANLESDQQLLHYYTGLETAKKLITVFATLAPAVKHLTYGTFRHGP